MNAFPKIWNPGNVILQMRNCKLHLRFEKPDAKYLYPLLER